MKVQHVVRHETRDNRWAKVGLVRVDAELTLLVDGIIEEISMKHGVRNEIEVQCDEEDFEGSSPLGSKTKNIV